jgi:hypothetical protein
MKDRLLIQTEITESKCNTQMEDTMKSKTRAQSCIKHNGIKQKSSNNRTLTKTVFIRTEEEATANQAQTLHVSMYYGMENNISWSYNNFWATAVAWS